MKQRQQIIPVAIMLLSLCACSSSTVSYHTLVSPAQDTGPASSALAIELLPVSVPAQLDMQAVVIRLDNSRMRVLDNDRWLSPLPDELHTALAGQMAQRAGVQDVSGLATADSQQVVRVQLQIRQFDSWPGHEITLDADWSLSTQRGEQRVRVLCRSQLRQPVSGDYHQLFVPWQGVVAQLAIQIADSAIALAKSPTTTYAVCPG